MQSEQSKTRDERAYSTPFPIHFVRWLRGWHDIPKYGSTLEEGNMATHRILGDRFTGKSALVEAIGTRHFQNGSSIYDIFGANDNEMLAWGESPFFKDVILVHGDDVKLQTSNYAFECVRIGKLDPLNVPAQKIFVTCRNFYPRSFDDYHYYTALYRLVKRFRNRDSFNRVDCILIRESDEFISSAKIAGKARSQSDASEEFAIFHNQMYHYGYALVVDQHREVDILKKVRQLSTFTYFKNLGGDIEIPRPWWMLRKVDPDRLLRAMKPNQFLLKTHNGCLALGKFMLAPWHIHRGAGLMGKLGITPMDAMNSQPLPVASGEAEEGAPKNLRGRSATKMTPEMKVILIEKHNRGVKGQALLNEMREVGFKGGLLLLYYYIRQETKDAGVKEA